MFSGLSGASFAALGLASAQSEESAAAQFAPGKTADRQPTYSIAGPTRFRRDATRKG
jgi:hypothetical protein